jgi:hypothetical protein
MSTGISGVRLSLLLLRASERSSPPTFSQLLKSLKRWMLGWKEIEEKSWVYPRCTPIFGTSRFPDES